MSTMLQLCTNLITTSRRICIYTLRVQNHLIHENSDTIPDDQIAFAFELVEMSVDLPFYKNFREYENALADVEAKLRTVEGGYVALVDGVIAGGILLEC